MIDVSLKNFETEVIAASMTSPLLIDFWSPRSAACKSLVPLLSNGKAAHKTEAHTQLNAGATEGRAVRTDRHRFIQWKAKGETFEELYDHAKDPHEFTNLAGKAEAKAELDRHRALLPKA